MVLAFRTESKGTEVIPEISLENGDSFLIPSVPSTVNAVGAIFNQNSFLYRPDAARIVPSAGGGPNTDADRKHMFLVKANGAVVSRGSVKGAWGDEFLRLKLSPGDTIVVPDKSIKPSALRELLTIPAIFSQVMYGVAAANIVF